MEQRRGVIDRNERRVLTVNEVVAAEGVSRFFRSAAEVVRAVDDVSFTARTGEFVCIHGASGSGKSTLLGLLAGLDQPDSGEVVVGGHAVSSRSASERAKIRLDSIGVVFQHDNLIEEFTARENVAFPMELRGGDKATIADEVDHWLHRVGMDGYQDRYPHELSGGQQQRVGIARALAGQRRLLIADEPTGALDSTNTAALFTLLRELSDDGATIVMTSHDPTARTAATRAVEMVDGRLRE